MGHGQHGASRAVGSQHTHPSLHPVPEHLRALPQAQGSGSPIPGIPPQDPRSSTGAQGSQGQTQGSGLRDPDRCEKDRRETQKETRGPQRGRRDDRTGGRDSERRQKEVRDDGDSGERAADGERRWSQGGCGQRADTGGLPPRSLAPGTPASGASPQRRLGHPHLQQRPGVAASPQRRCSSPKPGVRQPGAGCGPHTVPFSRERRLKPTPRPFLLSQTPRGLTGGRGPDEGGEGARPMSLSHSPPADARAGRHCLLRRSPSAGPGSLPAFLPRALRPQALPRPAPHPHSRSQVTSRPHLPACQNRSPPEPDPSPSRHTASSLRFRNSGVQNSGRLDTSERGHPPVGRGSEEDKDHTCEGHCVCGGRVSPHQSPLHP